MSFASEGRAITVAIVVVGPHEKRLLQQLGQSNVARAGCFPDRPEPDVEFHVWRTYFCS